MKEPVAIINDANALTRIAFVTSLIGGILILASSVIVPLFLGAYSTILRTQSVDAAGLSDLLYAIAFVLAGWGLVLGAIVIVGAFKVRRRPGDAQGWGIAILVAGLLSLASAGGFFIGAPLAAAGGFAAILAARLGAPRGS